MSCSAVVLAASPFKQRTGTACKGAAYVSQNRTNLPRRGGLLHNLRLFNKIHCQKVKKKKNTFPNQTGHDHYHGKGMLSRESARKHTCQLPIIPRVRRGVLMITLHTRRILFTSSPIQRYHDPSRHVWGGQGGGGGYSSPGGVHFTTMTPATGGRVDHEPPPFVPYLPFLSGSKLPRQL